MDLEARSLQPSLKANLLVKLREYKSDLNNLKREVKKASSVDSQTARDELLESGMSDALMASADQRGRLLMSTERLNQSSGLIKESRRTILETEELGVSILQDLHQQRQTLLHTHDTILTDLSSTLEIHTILTSERSRLPHRILQYLTSPCTMLCSCLHYQIIAAVIINKISFCCSK
ncbi:hypothetical protein KI387_004792, partial [Taxus chinensis]